MMMKDYRELMKNLGTWEKTVFLMRYRKEMLYHCLTPEQIENIFERGLEDNEHIQPRSNAGTTNNDN